MQNEFETLITLPIAKAFAKYLISNDFINADFVLIEGLYHIQDIETLEIKETNKDGFINWMEERINSSEDKKITYKISITQTNEVVLTFRMGHFPYLVKTAEDFLLGLNIKSNGKKIYSITTINLEFPALGGEGNLPIFWAKAFPNKPYVYSKAIDWYHNSIPTKVPYTLSWD